MASRCRSTLALAVLLAAACSGGGSGDKPVQQDPQQPQNPQAKLSIAYSALTVKVGDAVALTAHVENASGAVAWSLAGPGALSAAAGDKTTYQAVAPGVGAVTAAVAGLSASVSIKVVPPTDPLLDVTGLVLNQNGYPIANQAVYVLGDPSTLTSTDGSGHFTITGLTAPYDLVMVEDALNRVYVYRGLTRADPTLYVFTQGDQTNFPFRAMTLFGSTFGGNPFPTPGELQAVHFVSPAVDQPLDFFAQADLVTIPGPYALGVTWRGPLVTTGTLVGLEMRRDPGTFAPVDYWYAAQPNVTIMGGQFLNGPPLTLMPVATANTQGDIVVPPLYALTAKSMSLTFEGGVIFPIYFDLLSLAQPNFKYIAPDIHGATTQVCASAVNTVMSLPGASITCIDALAPATDDATLEILAAPQPFAPANGANAVDLTTTFAWSAFAGGVHLVEVEPSSDDNPTYFIFTAGTSTTIPDLSTVGLKFGTDDYDWSVLGFAPFADMDAFTAGIPAATVFLKQLLIPPVPNSSVGAGQTYEFSH